MSFGSASLALIITFAIPLRKERVMSMYFVKDREVDAVVAFLHATTRRLMLHTGPLFVDEQLVPTVRLLNVPSAGLTLWSHFKPTCRVLPHFEVATFHSLPSAPQYEGLFSGPFHFAYRWSLPVMLQCFHRVTQSGGTLLLQTFFLSPICPDRKRYLALVQRLFGQTMHLTLSMTTFLDALVQTKWHLVGCDTAIPCVWSEGRNALLQRWTEGEGRWMRQRYGHDVWEAYRLYLLQSCALYEDHWLLPAQFRAVRLE